MRGADVLGLVAAVLLLLAGCATATVQPAEPPGSEVTAETAEAKAAPAGADGSVEYDNPGLRDKALRNMRAYCAGPFTILEEGDRWTMKLAGVIPVPTKRRTIYFRCGEEEQPEEEAVPPGGVGRR